MVSQMISSHKLSCDNTSRRNGISQIIGNVGSATEKPISFLERADHSPSRLGQNPGAKVWGLIPHNPRLTPNLFHSTIISRHRWSRILWRSRSRPRCRKSSRSSRPSKSSRSSSTSSFPTRRSSSISPSRSIF